MKKAQDMYIHLKGLKIYAFHGVFAQENKIGAEYTINIRLKTDFSQAAQTDKLENTINYGEVFDVIKSEMSIPSKLLEHVVYRIAEKLFNEFLSVEEVHIELYKQNPPMGAECMHTGIEVTYFR